MDKIKAFLQKPYGKVVAGTLILILVACILDAALT